MSEPIDRRRMLRRGAALFGGAAIAAVPSGLRGDAACLSGARIRWIVGWTPGGGFDTYSRLAEPFLERALGAQIAIDNVPGAGGMVGALALSRARPDGRTLGILNGSGFLWNRSPDARATPDLERDFTVLARVARRQQVIVAGPGAGVRTVGDLKALARRRALVAGITSPDSSNFASLAAVTDLLGVRTEYVAGYPGSREVILGLLRGDCDITSVDVESYLQVPDLERAHPLLQITPERSPDPRIADVPRLAGTDGLIALEPALFQGDAARARAITAAIAAYLEFGRLFAAPARLPAETRACVERGMRTALADPAFGAAALRAGRSIDVLVGDEIRGLVPSMKAAVRPIEPVATAAARTIR